jgi:hypothetical protein
VILGDGGELFTLACGVWISGWVILFLSRDEIRSWINSTSNALKPDMTARHS